MVFTINESTMMKCSSLLIVLLLNSFGFCNAKCSPSACGIIPHISSPFRLKGDPKNCGNHRFELRCENNVTSISLNSHKYYVKAINYHNSTIRLVDASLNNDDICSFPTYSAYDHNFTYDNRHRFPYTIPRNVSSDIYDVIPYPINFVSCPHPLKNYSLVTDCASNPRYSYIKVGHLNASELPPLCGVEVIVMTSWQEFKDLNNVSLLEIHQSLLYGFELTVCPWCGISSAFPVWELLPILVVILGVLCAAVSPPVFTIFGFAAVSLLLYHILSLLVGVIYPHFIILAPRVIIFPIVLWLLIYKFRRRHLSMYNTLESFLQSDNKLTTIRYSYSNITKMTRDFQEKLGEGGYGSVYKGKLRSGHDVAVKLLRKFGANDQDFMNEIATIGRIHHVNVVNLVGYCAQGSKRALVYDFMPNGSLEKYLFNPEKMNSLNWDTKFNIAVGIARGIEYLHRGCDIQILHFDIKPHNILLNDKFIPKISDFGLAKFCSTDKKTVTMTAARGTIGYVAPEFISRSIGAVSYKADVYSFGMLLMEMVGLNRDLRGKKGGSSQHFPYWIYDSFEKGKDIDFEKDEKDDTRKVARKMTIVALWCIQMSPDDRPSMSKVLQMLEGDVERLHAPNHPCESSQIVMNFDQSEITCSSDSVSLLRHYDASLCIEVAIQE
ncbi:LEAF RUST 10 DISEASE-RESISTANCE LOCUS RECEPTOR-LIKE PROTEIN KINASE-like 2.4 isoform X2 [Salvia miltiorrhiza]|uniref:LEAF RUST 10 DISEASE-RESISTANCE LOCUS RECEPTOR-LIKE PROTEIN KINASE-like 2.4 isoform X2 n=1 Tax=Salvia miltiorrhiza TaxID=226208 RepID=UPI0025ACBF89|nr:LEAF RUST 10 DISEASE-RESISTANCE LOCUS RECEPTOR-LIKE PROTEIN KINASE-like 2.4 isoform X2 [Salvia miltiorrhiza]